jgi:hypothetical protein
MRIAVTRGRGRRTCGVARVRRIAVVVAGLLVLTACASSSGSPASGPDGTKPTPKTTTAAIEALFTERVIPTHEKLTTAARKLAESLSRCDARDEHRRAWRDAQLVWSAASVYRFEPQKTERLASFMNWWPVDTAAIEAAATGSAPMTTAEFDALGSSVRGLGAIEVIVFGTPPLDARRCSYDLAARAATTTEKFRAFYPTFVTMKSAVSDTLATLADAVFRLGDEDLARAAKQPVADAALLHEGPAAAGSDSVRAQINEIFAGYKAGLLPLLKGQYKDRRDPFAFEKEAVDKAMDAVGDNSLRTIFRADPQVVYTLASQLNNARRSMATSIAGLLGVTLVTPVGDGD